MTPARAAEVLRGGKSTVYEQVEAQKMGAEALEFQAWLFDLDQHGRSKIMSMYGSCWNGNDLFLDFARAEWEKERKG
jgi:hypothetical protein